MKIIERDENVARKDGSMDPNRPEDSSGRNEERVQQLEEHIRELDGHIDELAVIIGELQIKVAGVQRMIGAGPGDPTIARLEEHFDDSEL